MSQKINCFYTGQLVLLFLDYACSEERTFLQQCFFTLTCLVFGVVLINLLFKMQWLQYLSAKTATNCVSFFTVMLIYLSYSLFFFAEIWFGLNIFGNFKRPQLRFN